MFSSRSRAFWADRSLDSAGDMKERISLSLFRNTERLSNHQRTDLAHR